MSVADRLVARVAARGRHATLDRCPAGKSRPVETSRLNGRN